MPSVSFIFVASANKNDALDVSSWCSLVLSSFVTTRLDYCNSIFAGLPKSTLETLQRVTNAVARLIFNLRGRGHVTVSLIQLHWLPVEWRIQLKLCVHSLRYGRAPRYIVDLVQLVSVRCNRPGLRSSAQSTNNVKPRLRTTCIGLQVRRACLLLRVLMHGTHCRPQNSLFSNQAFPNC